MFNWLVVMVDLSLTYSGTFVAELRGLSWVGVYGGINTAGLDG